jgi:peptidoglycan/LPS O-acetylase OafA/YrhL
LAGAAEQAGDATGEAGAVANRSDRSGSARIRGHLPALDGVRGLAILMVLLYHFVAQTAATNRYEAILNRALGFGFLGVDLFFVLSGFLITGILYDSHSDRYFFRSFYMRRFLRIFPLYYAVLAVVFLVLPSIPSLRGSELVALREHQAWAWLYGVNIFLALRGEWALSYIEHFWSLAVEEHFYMVWPLIVWVVARRPRRLMWTALAIAVVATAARAWAVHAGANEVATTVLTPFQLDGLLLGGLFAVWLRQPGGEAAVRRWMLPMATASLGFIVLQFGLHRVVEGGVPAIRALRYAAYHVVFSAVILHAILGDPSSPLVRFFRNPAMVALGKYSYGLYVYHHFLSFYFAKHGTEFALASIVGSHTLAVYVQALAGMAASFGVAWLSYELFEKHFLRLKSLWPSGRLEGSVERQAAAVARSN